jgi:glycosyltransferase involved in cell wall biosynthesis
MRLRVVFVAGRAWPAVGGAEALVRSVASALSERHDVTVVAYRVDDEPSTRLSDGLTLPPPFEPVSDGAVRYEPLRLSKARRAGLAPLAMQFVPVARRYAYGRARGPAASLYASIVAPAIARHAQDADVVHTWSADLIAAAGVRAARLVGARSVITPFLHVGQWGGGPASIGAYRAADRVVGLLDTERRGLVDIGAPADRVRVCGSCSPGVDGGAGERVRTEHGIHGRLVLFLGARREYKGADLLVAASRRVAERVPEVTFAFVGPGPPLAAVGGARLIDAGSVGADERAAWLDAADLLCLPSAHEIFPISVLEAWSVGTPVLVSDLPPLRELIDRSGGGAFVRRDARALADALVDQLADTKALRARGRRGQDFWRTHATPAAVASCHESQYAELLGRAA